MGIACAETNPREQSMIIRMRRDVKQFSFETIEDIVPPYVCGNSYDFTNLRNKPTARGISITL